MSSRAVVRTLWAVAAGSVAVTAIGMHRSGSDIPVPDVAQVATAGDGLNLLWVGDVMLGDAARDVLQEHGYSWPFEHVHSLLDGDFVIANAEAPITTLTAPWDTAQHWHYNVQPAAAAALDQAGVDALGLANNHAMDRGPRGVADTRAHAAAAGLLTMGAGANHRYAELPLLVRTPHVTVGIVALGNYYGRAKMANDTAAGTVALSRASIRRGYRLAREAGADFVVGYVHWGRNYSGLTDEQRAFAAEFADAGYALVVGHHPHVVQPIEVVKGVPVVYSLGNFVFGSPGRFTRSLPGFGLVLTTEFTQSGLQKLTLRCIVTDNERVQFQPRPCDAEEADSVFTSLNPKIIVRGEVGTFPVGSGPAPPGVGRERSRASGALTTR